MTPPMEFEISDIGVTLTDDGLAAYLSCMTPDGQPILLRMKRSVLEILRNQVARAAGSQQKPTQPRS